MKCDWNIFVSIQNDIKPTPTICLAIMITLTKYNLNKQSKFQTDDRRCHDQQQGWTKTLLCQNGDSTRLPHCHILFCLRFEPNWVINSWMALKSNGRQAGCYAQIWGWAFLAAVPVDVLKLIMITVSLQMKLIFS